MPAALDLVPQRPGHALRHFAVDDLRHQPVVGSLPHVDRTHDRTDIEFPLVVEHLGIAHQSIASLRKTLRAHLAKKLLHPRRAHQLAVVAVHRLQQLFEIGPPEMRGRDAERGVKQTKTRFEMQREESPESIDFGKMRCCPVFAERAVAPARDAADMAQPRGINVSRGGQRPRSPLRPARNPELAATEPVRNRHKILRPAFEGAGLQGSRTPDARTIHANET